MSKGDATRPRAVSREEWDRKFEAIFGKERPEVNNHLGIRCPRCSRGVRLTSLTAVDVLAGTRLMSASIRCEPCDLDVALTFDHEAGDWVLLPTEV